MHYTRDNLFQKHYHQCKSEEIVINVICKPESSELGIGVVGSRGMANEGVVISECSVDSCKGPIACGKAVDVT